MNIKEEIIKGIFIGEEKNRFIASVSIDNKICECYIPSSSKLENYINLKGKEVLLKKNKDSKSRTKYSLLAVKYYNSYVILNLNMANNLVLEYIQHKEFITIKREKFINNYKSDLFIEDINKIVEVKAFIATRKEVIFPTVYSERALKQLREIKILLNKGYKVDYYFIGLSSIVKKVKINGEKVEYYKLLKECIDKGMDIRGFNIKYEDNSISIYKKIKVEI